MEAWVLDQWRIKEQLLEGYAQNGRFPADEGFGPAPSSSGSGNVPRRGIKGAGFIETRVRLAHWYDIGKIFGVAILSISLYYINAKIYSGVRSR